MEVWPLCPGGAKDEWTIQDMVIRGDLLERTSAVGLAGSRSHYWRRAFCRISRNSIWKRKPSIRLGSRWIELMMYQKDGNDGCQRIHRVLRIHARQGATGKFSSSSNTFPPAWTGTGQRSTARDEVFRAAQRKRFFHPARGQCEAQRRQVFRGYQTPCGWSWHRASGGHHLRTTRSAPMSLRRKPLR